MAIGIYKITNLINGQSYIGQSKDIKKRWSVHKKAPFKENSHSYNYPLYKAIRKYGLNNFSFEVLEECKVEELNQREKYWIQHYNTFFNGYNQTLGGDSSHNGSIDKKNIIGIIQDLENTQMFHREIAEKWNISIEMVQGINTGRYWKQDRDYPIQKLKINKYPKHNYCIDCGKEIFKTSTRCNNCEAQRRAKEYKIPVSREELKNLIRTTSFLQIGKKYNVTDNAIRKWCDKYNLPRRKKDIKSYSNEEWELI